MQIQDINKINIKLKEKIEKLSKKYQPISNSVKFNIITQRMFFAIGMIITSYYQDGQKKEDLNSFKDYFSCLNSYLVLIETNPLFREKEMKTKEGYFSEYRMDSFNYIKKSLEELL